MKQKFKNTQRGITLVALVITIIVLLILAMVSIKIAIDGGLITKVSKATETHTIAAEKEAIQLGYSTYQMDLAKKGSATLAVEGSSTITQTSDEGWDIAFKVNNYHLDKNGNITEGNEQDTNVPTEDLEYLRKELLGEDEKGKEIGEIGEYNGSYAGYINSIEFNNEQIKSLIPIAVDKLLIEYNNSIFRLEMSMQEWKTKSLNYVSSKYIPSGREGQKIEYSYDGTDVNKKEWTILYDYGDSVEIISPEAIGTLKLGAEDSEAQGSNDWEKAVYSYNHAIERLNNYASNLVTNPNKISVRSVGSNPTNPNYRNTTKYTSETIENWNCVIDGKYNSSTGKYEGGTPVTVNGVAEVGENNCEQDIIRMSAFGVIGTGNRYYIASRYVDANSYGIGFRVYAVDQFDNFGGNGVLAASSSGAADVYSNEDAVRPVVKISLNS